MGVLWAFLILGGAAVLIVSLKHMGRRRQENQAKANKESRPVV